MKFEVNKNIINIKIENEKLTSANINFFQANFEFDKSWENLTKEVIILKENEEKGITRAIIDNKIYIDQSLEGAYYIGVIGYTIENDKKVYQISTNLLAIFFEKGAGEIQTDKEVIPTLNEWEIYIKQIENLVKTVPDYIKNITENDIKNWNNKVDKITGKGLSTNDFTDEYKTKIDNYDTKQIETDINNLKTTKADKIELTLLEDKIGNKVTLNIDSNYLMTLNLLNAKNEVLSSATIDFPIESMIINASYMNGIITLILQNGTTLDVNISNLINGLVNETTFKNTVQDLQNQIISNNDELNNLVGEVSDVKQEIGNIKTEQTLQNDRIQENTNKNIEQDNKITNIETKNTEQDDLINTSLIKPIVTGNPIALNDSTNNNILGYKAFGNSKQSKTTGKNLFKPEIEKKNYIINENGTETSQNNGCIYKEIIINPNTNYVISCVLDSVSFGIRIAFYDENHNFIERLVSFTQPYTFKTPVNAKYLKFSPRIDVTSIQLELGNTATDYEPYTGGYASPNPDYPQEIVNDIVTDITVNKRNIYNATREQKVIEGITNSADNQYINLNGVSTGGSRIIFGSSKFKKGKYTLSIKIDSGNIVGTDFIVLYLYEKDKWTFETSVKPITNNLIVRKTFELTEDKELELGLVTYKDKDYQNIKIAYEIYCGNKEYDDIEPYYEDKIVLQKPVVLRGNNFARDEIDFDNKIQRIEHYEFTGNENFYGYGTPRVVMTFSGMKKGAIMSNYFQNVGKDVTTNVPNAIYAFSDNHFFINTEKTIDEFKQWLKDKKAEGKPVYMEYILLEPKIIPLPEADKKALRTLKTYYPNTTITSEAEQEITYIADTKNYIDNKIASIIKTNLTN